ncbi:hypothetical protein Bca101_036531 [Brassica carinata]
MEIQRRGQNPKPDDVVVAIAMSTRQSIRTKSKTGGGTKPAGPGPQEIDKCASGVEVTMFMPQGLNQDSIGGSDVPAAEGINPVEQDCLDLLVGAVMKDAGLTTDDCANEHPVVEESHEDTVASRLAAGEIAKVSLADKSESADGTDAEAMNKTICMSMIGSGDNLMDEECPLVINETLGAEDGVQTASEADFTTATVDEPVVGGVAGNVADVCVLDDKSESAAETAAEAINKVADHVHVDEIGLGDDLMDEECPPVISETMGPEGGVQKESAEYMTPAFGEESILEGLEGNDPDAGVHVVDPGHGDVIGSHDDMTDGETEQKEGETGVMILSDSPTPMTARHIPVAEEEELASLLLAKSYYDLADMVPVIEDRDYPFFERVLQSNPQVVVCAHVRGCTRCGVRGDNGQLLVCVYAEFECTPKRGVYGEPLEYEYMETVCVHWGAV